MTPRLGLWRSSGRFFDWNGHRVFFRDQGSGPAVLMLHGYPTGSFDWHAIWHQLGEDHRLIAPDFLGMGFSDKPRHHDYTLSGHARTIDALLTWLGVAQVHVVAHDLGVRVVQEMMAQRETHPGLASLDSVVLLNGAMCPQAYRPRPIQRLLAGPIGARLGPRIPRFAFESAIRGLFGKHTQPSPALLDEFWALLEHGGGRQVTHAVGAFWRVHPTIQERLVGALLRSQAALRLINGSADPNSGSHMVNQWLTMAPQTDVVRFDTVGHWPHIEVPQLTASAIVEFWTTLRRTGPQGQTQSKAVDSVHGQWQPTAAASSLQPGGQTEDRALRRWVRRFSAGSKPLTASSTSPMGATGDVRSRPQSPFRSTP